MGKSRTGWYFNESLIKVIPFLLLFLPVFSYAADYDITICKIQSHSTNNNAYIKPCAGWGSKNGCLGGGWLTWDISRGQGAHMYNTALEAFRTGDTVTVRLDGSSCQRYDVTSMIRASRPLP